MSPFGTKRIPLKRTIITTLVAGSFFLTACQKNHDMKPPAEPCVLQVDNPAGRSYTSGSIAEVSYSHATCGLLPLSSKNYWVYEDSVYVNGVFNRVQMDTLRMVKSYQSTPDNLIWWKISPIEIGLPDMLYASDSAIFQASYRMFSTDPILDAKKEYGLFTGDSTRYLTSFEDYAAMGRSVKCSYPIVTRAGSFEDCILFEKKAPGFRLDQVYLKPGIGVVRYSWQEAVGSPTFKTRQISTLVSVHFE